MPLFYTHTINETTKLGVWKIEEDEDFFLQAVPLQREITHPHKRLQHLAGRYLLRVLFPDFPYHLIEIAATRKPYIPNELYHFSISHCGSFAAAIVSTTQQVGIDIEIASPKVARIRHKFLHTDEITLLQQTSSFKKNPETAILPLTLIWSAKEAVFKWYGMGQVDFKSQIRVLPADLDHSSTGNIPGFFEKEHKIPFLLHYQCFEELCLVWLAT